MVRKKDGSVHNRSQWVTPGSKKSGARQNEPEKPHERVITEDFDKRFNVEPYDQKKWERQIEFHLDGSRPEDRNMEMGKTPFVLSKVGLKDLPLEIAPRVVDKVMGAEDQIKHGHGLSKEIVSRILEAISDPIAVMESLTQKGTFIVLTSILDHRKRPIIVSIHPDRRSGRNQVNEVMSFYGRNNFKEFWKMSLAELKYFDNKKGPEWLQSIGVQFPKEGDFRASGTSIVLKSDIVNKESAGHQNDRGVKKSQGRRRVEMLLLVPIDLSKSIKNPKLVPEKITVARGGTTFQQTVLVDPADRNSKIVQGGFESDASSRMKKLERAKRLIEADYDKCKRQAKLQPMYDAAQMLKKINSDIEIAKKYPGKVKEAR